MSDVHLYLSSYTNFSGYCLYVNEHHYMCQSASHSAALSCYPILAHSKTAGQELLMGRIITTIIIIIVVVSPRIRIIAWMRTDCGWSCHGILSCVVCFFVFRRGRSSVSPPWTPDTAAWGRKTLNMEDTEYRWQGNVNNDFLVFCVPVIPQLGLDLQCGGGGGGDTFHVSPWHFSYTRPLDFTI